MYFDDRERLQDFEARNLFSWQNEANPWIISLSNEKRLALERYLGFNPESASKLTDEQVEEETLRWVVDSDIVLDADDNESCSSNGIESDTEENLDRHWSTTMKYSSIKDLVVASSCHSTLECLAFLWNNIADTLEDEISSPSVSSSQSLDSVKLIVFPKSESLWNYDTIVTMLVAIQIAQPLLPAQFDLRLDLFHPDYKHSPRMWSPQWHSPFPTVGFTIRAKEQPPIDDLDIDALRSKLDVLFQSGDATSKGVKRSIENVPKTVLEECQNWVKKEYQSEESQQDEFSRSSVDEENINWIVESRGSPFQLYRTVWNSALNVSAGHKSASIICDPFLDSHSLHRVAVTVNTALKRLHIPVRVTQVYHPFIKPVTDNCEYKTRPPHGMIQLSPADTKLH